MKALTILWQLVAAQGISAKIELPEAMCNTAKQPPHSELRRQNRTTLFSSCGCKRQRCQRRSACRSKSYSRRRVRTSAPARCGLTAAEPI